MAAIVRFHRCISCEENITACTNDEFTICRFCEKLENCELRELAEKSRDDRKGGVCVECD